MRNFVRITTILSLITLALLITGCATDNANDPSAANEGNSGKPEDATNTPEHEIKKIANLYLEGILKGMKDLDYKEFSTNFTLEMKKNMGSEDFKTNTLRFEKNKGNYLSSEYMGSLKEGVFLMAMWKAKYSKSKNDTLVRMRLGKLDGKFQIFGLWFY